MSDDLRFDPADVTTTKGSTITVTNVGSLQHDLKLRKGGEVVGGTAIVDAGKSACSTSASNREPTRCSAPFPATRTGA
jgi:plastocyanin